MDVCNYIYVYKLKQYFEDHNRMKLKYKYSS